MIEILAPGVDTHAAEAIPSRLVMRDTRQGFVEVCGCDPGGALGRYDSGATDQYTARVHIPLGSGFGFWLEGRYLTSMSAATSS